MLNLVILFPLLVAGISAAYHHGLCSQIFLKFVDDIYSSVFALPLNEYVSPNTESSAMERQEVSLNTSLLLEGLKPNTNYTAFVRAYSSFPSEISESLVFRTAEDGE